MFQSVGSLAARRHRLVLAGVGALFLVVTIFARLSHFIGRLLPMPAELG